MSLGRRISKEIILEGRTIETLFRRAVSDALRAHKRAGNTVASWEDGRVVLIPAERISVETETGVAQSSSRTTEAPEPSR